VIVPKTLAFISLLALASLAGPALAQSSGTPAPAPAPSPLHNAPAAAPNTSGGSTATPSRTRHHHGHKSLTSPTGAPGSPNSN
jgi:hypothetical protein